MYKDKLLKDIWNKKDHYYQLGSHSQTQFKNEYAYKVLKRFNIQPLSILEFGCGNGRVIHNLGQLIKRTKKLVGFDISPLAIKDAKKKYKNIEFRVGDAEKIKFDTKFELVSSFFTFEHLDDPERVLGQMAKLVEKNGYLYIICPNYGSPIFPSPCFKGNLFLRLIKGILRDVYFLFAVKTSGMKWDFVEPIIDQNTLHVHDYDTTVEPYIFSLKKYFEQNFLDYKIIFAGSGWETVKGPTVSKKYYICSLPLKLLSSMNIFTFKYWGPACVLLAQKVT